MKKRLSSLVIFCSLITSTIHCPKVLIDMVPRTTRSITLTIFFEEINRSNLGSSTGRLGKRCLLRLNRKINKKRSRKPVKSTSNSILCVLSVQSPVNSIAGISLNILRITIKDMISNCLVTQDVKDRGR